jgi:Zn-dependent M28 family amino/carboxypeptidase
MHKLSLFSLVTLLIVVSSVLNSQTTDAAKDRPYEKFANNVISAGLGSGKAIDILTELSVGVGPRLSGSPQAAKAVEWSKHKMEELGFQNVHLEKVMVPHWVRGDVEECKIVDSRSVGTKPLKICALGGSVGTQNDGITAEVIEVSTFDELKALGDQAKGKIIFFNRSMDRSKISTFEAYGGAVNQRGAGAREAAKAGGVAAIVRSMTTRLDDSPHTGAMGYIDSIAKVPAAAVSTIGANFLSDLIKKEKHVRLHLALSCQTLPDVESANVVGELTGSEKPNEVIVIGGHLDSWDKGRGAHDDGAGCAHVIEALRLLKELGFTPKRTIRAVTFINEENGTRGGKAYAALSRPGEKHIAALETDAGGFSPRGFGVTSDSVTFQKISQWEYLFAPIDADRIRKGGGGADIGELGSQGVPTIGLRVEGNRYFDYHHSENDTLDKVNERELELGAISIAILTYVLAQEGL